MKSACLLHFGHPKYRSHWRSCSSRRLCVSTVRDAQEVYPRLRRTGCRTLLKISAAKHGGLSVPAIVCPIMNAHLGKGLHHPRWGLSKLATLDHQRSANMAQPSYMTITGTAQGLISAGCSTEVSVGNMWQEGHTDEIMVLSLAHDMSHAGNSRHGTHHPVVITKLHDKSSPAQPSDEQPRRAQLQA